MHKAIVISLSESADEQTSAAGDTASIEKSAESAGSYFSGKIHNFIYEII